MAAPVVEVKQGWLRGTTVKSVTGGSYVSFKGIPFAAPPVGKLRFAVVSFEEASLNIQVACKVMRKIVRDDLLDFDGVVPWLGNFLSKVTDFPLSDPLPPPSWTGIRDASQFGPICPQPDEKQKKIAGDEDCLYLNVATTSLDGPRPVMVWIHGGGFFVGSGNDDMYGPDYLLEEGVVFVSMNYRLGILGFLQLDDPVASGNMGLKDQTAALKWVKENISQFGGDPNNITIFGESAGGASVHYQLLSPLSKGLFHKAIVQSGCTLDPWACMCDSADRLRRYLAAFGKETSDPKEIVEFLRTIPVEKLVQTQFDVTGVEDLRWVQLPFMPSVDDKSEKPFMPRHPKEVVLEDSHVPLMIGCTTHEGIAFVAGFKNSISTALDENSKLKLPIGFVSKNHPKKDIISDEVRKFYFRDKPITEDSADDWIQACGDIGFIFGLHKVVEIQQKTKKAPCYLYKFSYETRQSFARIFMNSSYKGAAHGDDVPLLFHMKMVNDVLKYKPGTPEKIVSNRMVRMWTNFAKTGNPTPTIDDLINVEWLPVSRTTKHYLNIDAELSTGINPDEKVVQFSHRISKILESG